MASSPSISSERTRTIDPDKLNALLGQAVQDMGAAMQAPLIVIGDKLGLYRAMGDGEPVTPAQLALAWVLAKGDDIVPIPGTKSPRRLEENAAAVDLVLSAAEVQELDSAISREAIVGSRYPEQMMGLLNN